jgi:hypothetical protein
MTPNDLEKKLTAAKIELRKSRTRLSHADTRQATARAEQDIQIWSSRINWLNAELTGCQEKNS